MLGFVLLSASLFSCNQGETKADAAAETPKEPAAAATPAPAEFADPKYAAIGKKGLEALSAGKVDEWMEQFADNAVYVWNNGDSLTGKAAISDYWKKRRGEVIDSISFSQQIWLPVKVNQPQANEGPGVWLLSWYRVNAAYKGGKGMQQNIHTAMHFNASDKIDRLIQYLDRAPIASAIKK